MMRRRPHAERAAAPPVPAQAAANLLVHDLKNLAGRLDETVVAVTSDHGTEFFEHGGKAHRNP